MLKRIALISMTLDHIGVILIEPLIGSGLSFTSFEKTYYLWTIIYWFFRLIGRLAFPLFAFALVEGFTHTRNRYHYLSRLVVFAVLSQPFFAMALDGSYISLNHLNIFFTLALGIITMLLFERTKDQPLFLRLGLVVAFAFLAEISNMDWGWLGIALIFGIYYFRQQPIYQFLVVVVLGSFQLTAPIAALLIQRYNGERGKVNKYFHYFYYPLHLFILTSLTKLN